MGLLNFWHHERPLDVAGAASHTAYVSSILLKRIDLARSQAGFFLLVAETGLISGRQARASGRTPVRRKKDLD
jgi:hypothetical protein